MVIGYAGGWFHPVTGYSFPIALEGFIDEETRQRARRAEVRRGSRKVDGLRPPLPVQMALWSAPRLAGRPGSLP